MALNFDKHHFDFETREAGRIRIRSYSMGVSGEFRADLYKANKIATIDLLRKLVSLIGRRYDESKGGIQPENLKPEIVDVISDEEIEEIARIFIEKNDWLYKDIDNPKYELIETDQGETVKSVSYEKKEIPRKESETYSAYLIRLVKSYEDDFSIKMARLGSSFAFKPPVMDQLRRSSTFFPQTFFSSLKALGPNYSPIMSLQSTVRELSKTSNLTTVLMANAANDPPRVPVRIQSWPVEQSRP